MEDGREFGLENSNTNWKIFSCICHQYRLLNSANTWLSCWAAIDNKTWKWGENRAGNEFEKATKLSAVSVAGNEISMKAIVQFTQQCPRG